MTPELLKELQEQAYPFQLCADPLACCRWTFLIDGAPYHTPLPHELIDAMGDDFRSLIRRDGGWEAHSTMFEDEHGKGQVDEWLGPDAITAVARLYIAIQERKNK